MMSMFDDFHMKKTHSRVPWRYFHMISDSHVYDIDIIDIMLDYVRSHTAEGKDIIYSNDSRIIIK